MFNVKYNPLVVKRYAIIREGRKTFLGLIHHNYKSLRRMADKINTTFLSRKDFVRWVVEDQTYNKLFEAWKQENFSIDAEPSIDQINADKGFVLNNLIWRRVDEANKLYMAGIRRANREKWDKIDSNPTLKAYYAWNGVLSKYGITRKDWTKLVIQSNGCCMLQGEQFKNPRDCHIDHDHKTGKVRGLLCARCNHLLAGLDNLEFRHLAFKYLGEIQD